MKVGKATYHDSHGAEHNLVLLMAVHMTFSTHAGLFSFKGFSKVFQGVSVEIDWPALLLSTRQDICTGSN